jgi:hypothetical protein
MVKLDYFKEVGSYTNEIKFRDRTLDCMVNVSAHLP